MAGGRAALIRRFAAARRDPDLALLEGLHVLKHALRFGAEIEVACTPDLSTQYHSASPRLATSSGCARRRRP